MASAGPNMNASQFYITLADNLDYLDGKHTIFGEVAEGLDVLDKLSKVFVDDKSRPLKNIRIRHTVILDDPFPDPATLAVPDQSPVAPRDRLGEDYIASDDEQLAAELSKKSQAEMEEEIARKEERNRAEVLEMLGDLPTADFIPPENVLFVCKLNPVTTSEDLELIFSRFGTIKKCEVIRDWKTNDSLQYAFIEFETDKECEQAYLKMENILIDDRRIHVDFSQSVGGLWNAWRRGDKMDQHDRAGKAQLHIKGSGPAPNPRYQMVFDHSKSIKKQMRTRRLPSPTTRNRRSPSPPKRSRRSPSPPPRRKRSRSADGRLPDKRRHRPRSRSRSRDRQRSRR